jgi:alpha-D-ribose 1-methylphosphonate 5-triphosphate synthase subunit PhnG
MHEDATDAGLVALRRRALTTLADCATDELRAAVAGVDRSGLVVLRPAEIGLTMVRGRMGGTGAPFNLGEMTVTRCAVTDGVVVGHGYVRGRDAAKAELVACCDALLQAPARRAAVLAAVIEPLEAALAARRDEAARRAAATRVDFFTLVRGDG